MSQTLKSTCVPGTGTNFIPKLLIQGVAAVASLSATEDSGALAIAEGLDVGNAVSLLYALGETVCSEDVSFFTWPRNAPDQAARRIAPTTTSAPAAKIKMGTRVVRRLGVGGFG